MAQFEYPLPEDLKKVRLVITDMDGTLLNARHEVSDRFFELYRSLSARGVIFGAASGRQYQSIVQKLPEIRENMVIIAENGGLATYQGQELVSTPLPLQLRNEVLSALENVPGTYAVLCGKDNAYVKPHPDNFLDKLREYYTGFEIHENLHAFQGEIMKIAAYHFESSEQYIYPAVKQFETDLMVKVSGAHWVDLSHVDAHKGFALKIVQEHLGIAPEETMVFGDYNNDLEMMSRADFSFAMANAHPNVLDAARYQTASNEERGVDQVLEKLAEALG
ncbi:hypothetical protein SAMN04490243_2289 [Robiginitalea myxolifaciens]|uniref:Uncharacterized protein n=1 Tax=Robiginitalea myxolifaciens TaxID=400055 RepID=A0A1I6H5H3_9FLAO|nr:HAD family hydrolase [Robiginitalea myxolifaciens]SFR49688.1 hypothetical protein SAMN04490243_2289 [Robiginitalea myxolifaciens]